MKEQDAAHSFEKIPWGKQEDIDALNTELTRLRSELQQAKQEIANHTLANSLLLDSAGEADLANKIYQLTSELQQKDEVINELLIIAELYKALPQHNKISLNATNTIIERSKSGLSKYDEDRPKCEKKCD